MKREERREQSLECFAKKYDLDYEVTYTELIGDSPELRDEIHVYVASYMEEGESAVIYSYEQDEEVITEDNLFRYIIRAEYEDTILQVVNTYFDDAKVYSTFASSSFDASLGKNKTLQDAYDLGEKMLANISVIVRTDADETAFKKSMDEISEILKSKKRFGMIHGYAVTDASEYEDINRMNFQRKVNVFAEHANVKMPYNVYNTKSYK